MNLDDLHEKAAKLYGEMPGHKRARYLLAMRQNTIVLKCDGVEAWAFWMAMVEHCFGDRTEAVFKAMKKTVRPDVTPEFFIHALRMTQPTIYAQMPETFWMLGFSLFRMRQNLENLNPTDPNANH